jgi:hypothetical protein
MKNPTILSALCGILCGHVIAAEHSVPTLVPYYQYVQTLVAAQEMEKQHYLAFPVMTRLGTDDLLIGYKRGKPYFNLVTYKQINGRMPDILRMEFDWDEVK